MSEDTTAFSDVTCSICGRHNREVRVVATENGLVVCQVCVAKCADIFDQEVGLDAPEGGWIGRWPLKR
jgi:ClpX C4-type zinc finger